ncbi:transformer 2 beta [Glugoides intestinalis]
MDGYNKQRGTPYRRKAYPEKNRDNQRKEYYTKYPKVVHNGYKSNQRTLNSERMSDFDYISQVDTYKRPEHPRAYLKRPRVDKGNEIAQKVFKMRHVPAEPNNTVGVFGFSQYTNEEDVKKLLAKRLKNLREYTYKLITDERTGLCKGFCFVDFKCLEDAIIAKDILSFESLWGLDFKCDFSYKQGTNSEQS